jgi:hypothetical protein
VPAIYEARGWVPGPGQFSAPPPKATQPSSPDEKTRGSKLGRRQDAADAAAGVQVLNRVPGPKRTPSEEGWGDDEEALFWGIPSASAPVEAPAKKPQGPVKRAEDDEAARARARRLAKEKEILANHVKFGDWEQNLRQQRAAAERAEVAARRGQAKANNKPSKKRAPRGGTNPFDFDDSPRFARFFVAVGNSREDVEKSVQHSAWTSITRTGNRKLDLAYREVQKREECPGPVYLFFTVDASGVFCGVAEMVRENEEPLLAD